MTVTEQKFWVVIPAAGIGKRMNADRPKQYLTLLDKTVLEHTLSIFTDHERISGVIVALAEHDEYWPSLNVKSSKPLLTVIGGKDRCDSVLNALNGLKELAEDKDWALVHDAARPCLCKEDLDRLLISMSLHRVGGLLAAPVADTLKKVSQGCTVEKTVDREHVWRALTPQMFHVGKLRKSLIAAKEKKLLVTDESSAMEFAGYEPLVIEGHPGNIKITQTEDLALAEFYLANKQRCQKIKDQKNEANKETNNQCA